MMQVRLTGQGTQQGRQWTQSSQIVAGFDARILMLVGLASKLKWPILTILNYVYIKNININHSLSWLSLTFACQSTDELAIRHIYFRRQNQGSADNCSTVRWGLVQCDLGLKHVPLFLESRSLSFCCSLQIISKPKPNSLSLENLSLFLPIPQCIASLFKAPPRLSSILLFPSSSDHPHDHHKGHSFLYKLSINKI